MKSAHFFSLFIFFLSIGCSKDADDNNNIIKNQTGTVLTEVSCNTKNNGLAYSIGVDNFEAADFIITATLTEGVKQEGLRITFDMEPSYEGITICTANFFPNQFYKLSNITVLTVEN